MLGVQTFAEVRATAGFPADKKTGFKSQTIDLTIGHLNDNGSVFTSPDGWAAKYAPDIQNYIGWRLTYINDVI